MYSQSKTNFGIPKNLKYIVHVKCSSICTTLYCTCLVQFHINTNTETVYSTVQYSTLQYSTRAAFRGVVLCCTVLYSGFHLKNHQGGGGGGGAKRESERLCIQGYHSVHIGKQIPMGGVGGGAILVQNITMQ